MKTWSRFSAYEFTATSGPAARANRLPIELTVRPTRIRPKANVRGWIVKRASDAQRRENGVVRRQAMGTATAEESQAAKNVEFEWRRRGGREPCSCDRSPRCLAARFGHARSIAMVQTAGRGCGNGRGARMMADRIRRVHRSMLRVAPDLALIEHQRKSENRRGE